MAVSELTCFSGGKPCGRRGKAYLRLDCVAWNESLRAYHERAGYEHVGDVTVYEFTQSRYEKRAAT